MTSASAIGITAGPTGLPADAIATANAAAGLENNQAATAVNDANYNYLVGVVDNTLYPNGHPAPAAEAAYLKANFGKISSQALIAAATNGWDVVPIPTP